MASRRAASGERGDVIAFSSAHNRRIMHAFINNAMLLSHMAADCSESVAFTLPGFNSLNKFTVGLLIVLNNG